MLVMSDKEIIVDHESREKEAFSLLVDTAITSHLNSFLPVLWQILEYDGYYPVTVSLNAERFPVFSFDYKGVPVSITTGACDSCIERPIICGDFYLCVDGEYFDSVLSIRRYLNETYPIDLDKRAAFFRGNSEAFAELSVR